MLKNQGIWYIKKQIFVKVKDMIAKKAIEERRKRDEEAFGA